MNQTHNFLRNLDKIEKIEITDGIKLRFKQALLDYIGVTLAGARDQESKVEKLLIDTDSGASAVIGLDKNLSLENTVFFNGLFAHTLDFDDGTNWGIIHLGSPIFSVLLPLAQRYKISFDKFMKAAILGYESSFTMAISIQPKHKKRGYHATGTCSTLGIALAVAEMLDFSEKQRKDAFSVAAVSASGTLKVLEDGSDLKPYNVAKTALMGYISAKMGRAGFDCPDDVLSGGRGFLKLMYGDENVNLQPAMIEGTYALEKAYIKPYSACRYCHPAIEAALMIRKDNEINIDEILSIKVNTYSLAVDKHDHTNIEGCGSAKMSIPYSVAVALSKGSANMMEYSLASVTDSKVLDLTNKVIVIADEAMNATFPEKQSALVEVNMVDGKSYHKQVDFPKGEPENPMTLEEVREKFTSLTIYSGRSEEEADEIFSAVMDIENRFEELLLLISGTKNHK